MQSSTSGATESSNMVLFTRSLDPQGHGGSLEAGNLDEEAGQGPQGGSESPGSPQLLGGGSAAEPTREIIIT